MVLADQEVSAASSGEPVAVSSTDATLVAPGENTASASEITESASTKGDQVSETAPACAKW